MMQVACILAKALRQTVLRGCVSQETFAGYPIGNGPYTLWVCGSMAGWFARLQLLRAKALERTIFRDCVVRETTL